MRRGDWTGTVVPIFVCVSRGCVVWPRYVGQIRRLNICNHRFTPIQNVWWDFIPFSDRCNWTNNAFASWLGPVAKMTTQGRSPVFQDILGGGRTLRAYPSTPLDNNKFITVFGIDDDTGQPLMTQGVGGWSVGIKLQLKTPFVESTQHVRSIERVLKDETQGPVRLYAWNAASSVLEDVAYYDASETNPNYAKTLLATQTCCSTTDGSAASLGVVALVKLAFIPAKFDDDLIIIDNVEAIKNMVMCIRSEEAVDFESAAQYEQRAIRALNLDLADRDEAEQIPVSFGGLGRRELGLGRQRTF